MLPYEEGKEENVFPWNPDREENEAGTQEDEGRALWLDAESIRGETPRVGIRAGRDSEREGFGMIALKNEL